MQLTFVSGSETKLGPGAPNKKLDHGGKKQKMESAFILKKNSLPTDWQQITLFQTVPSTVNLFSRYVVRERFYHSLLPGWKGKHPKSTMQGQ